MLRKQRPACPLRRIKLSCMMTVLRLCTHHHHQKIHLMMKGRQISYFPARCTGRGSITYLCFSPILIWRLSHSRDQYGFKMSSQWLSVEDYHEHDKLYQPIVDRRAQKWQQILAENDGKWPEPSSKCKRAMPILVMCMVFCNITSIS